MSINLSVPYTTQQLIDMLKGNENDAKIVAARRIWTDWNKLRNKELLNEIIPVLFQILQQSENEREIWHCMLALGSLNHTDSIPIIMSNMETSSSENIRGFAAEALGRLHVNNITEEIVDKFFTQIENDSSIVARVNALRGIAKKYKNSKDDDLALKILGMVEQEKDAVVRSVMIETLGKIGSLKPVPELIHIMITRRVELLKETAAKALDRIARSHGLKDRKELVDQLRLEFDSEQN